MDVVQQWSRCGYFHVPGFFPSEQIERLRRACEGILSRYLELDPDTGEPGNPDANSLRHLHRPEYVAGQDDAFALLMETAADALLLETLEHAMGERPVFRDTSLWFSPFFTHRDGHWHRDLQYVVASDAEEKALVDEKGFQRCAVQVQIPTLPSDHLEIVPGSQGRWDTPSEYAIRKADGCRNRCSNDMPGSVRLDAMPGDVIAINPAAIHRGNYHSDKLRRTLQVTFTLPSRMSDYSSDQAWFFEPGYLERLAGPIREYYEDCRECIRAFRSAHPEAASWHP